MSSAERHRAFTLIEVLIVMAIIGILATVVVTELMGGRTSAQQAKTMASLRSAQTIAMFCRDDGYDLSVPSITNVICTGQENWPAPVGDTWLYGTVATCGFDGDVSDGDFYFCATNGTVVINCTEDGCLSG